MLIWRSKGGRKVVSFLIYSDRLYPGGLWYSNICTWHRILSIESRQKMTKKKKKFGVMIERSMFVSVIDSVVKFGLSEDFSLIEPTETTGRLAKLFGSISVTRDSHGQIQQQNCHCEIKMVIGSVCIGVLTFILLLDFEERVSFSSNKFCHLIGRFPEILIGDW